MVQGVSASANAIEKTAPAKKTRDILACGGRAKRPLERKRPRLRTSNFRAVVLIASEDACAPVAVRAATALQIVVITSVKPIAATNSPQSGRSSTATPPSKPAMLHQKSARLKSLRFFSDPSVSSVVNPFRNASVAEDRIDGGEKERIAGKPDIRRIVRRRGLMRIDVLFESVARNLCIDAPVIRRIIGEPMRKGDAKASCDDEQNEENKPLLLRLEHC